MVIMSKATKKSNTIKIKAGSQGIGPMEAASEIWLSKSGNGNMAVF